MLERFRQLWPGMAPEERGAHTAEGEDLEFQGNRSKGERKGHREGTRGSNTALRKTLAELQEGSGHHNQPNSPAGEQDGWSKDGSVIVCEYRRSELKKSADELNIRRYRSTRGPQTRA
jgi:hypothetical protein